MPEAIVPPGVKWQPRGNVRATVRYRCAPATLGRVVVSDDHEFQHAWVLDLSTTGVGLSLARPIEAGTEATVQIRSADGHTLYDLVGRVIHCTQQPQREWSVGCEFLKPLSPEDLDQLL